MIRYLFIVGLLLAATVSAQAATQVQGLYQVRVPVADQSASVRDHALDAALREVVIRASGTEEAVRDENLPSGPGTVDRLVQQYGYASTSDGLQLQVRFDGAAVEQMLRQQGLPVWGRERPTTLVWLAVQNGTDRRLLGSDEPGKAGEALRDAATTRGVPVLLPLLDLDDQSKVRFSDVWGGFFDNVLSASARYDADAILIGRLQRQSGGWVSRWTLYDRGQTRQWNTHSDQLATATEAGVDGLAETLAARYAEQPGSTTALDRIRVRVDDVRSLDDYAQLSKFLRSRELVGDTRLLAVSGDQAYFELAVRGSANRLQRTLRLWERLALVEPDVDAAAPGGDAAGTASAAAPGELHFRLVP